MSRFFFSLLILILLAGLALAQDTPDDSLFGGNTSSEQPSDDMFGDNIFTEVSNAPGAKPATDLFTTSGVSLGGKFAVATELSLDLNPVDGQDALSSGLTDLSTTLFLDARPATDFRAFVKGKLGYTTTNGVSFELKEAFADITIADTVFVRAGKQTVNWGVGYFFSPANLINLEQIDPENPGAELSGPIAFKAQLPLGADNLTGYLLTNDSADGNNFSSAARYEFLVSGFEVTTGGIIEDSGHWALMATASGSVQDVTLFAETVLEGNSTKVFVVKDSSKPTGLSTTTSDALYVSATLGARYSYTTEDDLYRFTGIAQYFFNGLGYEDNSIFTDNPAAIGSLVGSGSLNLSDLQERGQHYLAINLSSPDIAKSKLTPSALWLANLSDGSGFLNASLSYSGIDYVTPNIRYRYSYGTKGAEYSPNGVKHSLSLGFSLIASF